MITLQPLNLNQQKNKTMNILIVGASGATGRLLVQQLLNMGHYVKVIVRSVDRLPESSRNHQHLSVVQATLLDLTDTEMAQHAINCDAIVSCLGHNLTWKGVYGHPRRLVAEATRRLCNAVKANNPAKPVKFVLMNTAGNSNRDLQEPISFGERSILGLLRLLLPPHVDNEKASDYLRINIGQNDKAIEWVVVRPDTLINEENVTGYETHPSPIRSALFNPGKTSRINVGHFMADILTNDNLWNKWKGQMPVIYNVFATS